jgi:hypothetical protein
MDDLELSPKRPFRGKVLVNAVTDLVGWVPSGEVDNRRYVTQTLWRKFWQELR